MIAPCSLLKSLSEAVAGHSLGCDPTLAAMSPPWSFEPTGLATACPRTGVLFPEMGAPVVHISSKRFSQQPTLEVGDTLLIAASWVLQIAFQHERQDQHQHAFRR